MNGRYILDADGKPRLEPNLVKWAEWYEKDSNRRVQVDKVGDVRVSTIFLGLDNGIFPYIGPPLLWETMIFGGEHDGYQRRYTSLDAALEGHAKALATVKEKA